MPLMRRPAAIGHIGEGGAVAVRRLVPRASGFLPLRGVQRLKKRIALGRGMHLRPLHARRTTQTLPENIRTADHGDLSDQTPQRVATRDFAGSIERRRDDDTRRDISGIA